MGELILEAKIRRRQFGEESVSGVVSELPVAQEQPYTKFTIA
jgi:hypothetical protein